MEFHKKKSIFFTGLGIALVGGLLTALLVGWFFQGGRAPFLLFAAPLVLLVGLAVAAYGLIPFALRIDGHGITTKHAPAGLDTTVPWAHIAAITIERKPGDSEDLAPYVVLWTVPGVSLGTEPGFQRNGRSAYLLGQLDEITESEQEVRGALAHFSGGRFSGGAAPQGPGPGPQGPGYGPPPRGYTPQPQQYPNQYGQRPPYYGPPHHQGPHHGQGHRPY